MSDEIKPCGHHPDSGCTCRPPDPADGRLGGIGAPPGWAETRAQLLADAAATEAQARAALIDRVRAELQFRLDGEFMDPADGESMRRAAEVAVEVFVEWLRNPPERVVQADGSESARCNAVTGYGDRYGDRCGYPLGHPGSHAALNAGGAPCIVWG